MSNEGLCTKIASMTNDQGGQIVISPRSLASVPEPIGRYFASVRMTWLFFITSYLFHKTNTLSSLLTFYLNNKTKLPSGHDPL